MAKILVIDDDPDLVAAISTLLESRGFETVSAENGQQGFEKAKKELPDLILLDVMMATKTEGFDIARNLHDDSATKGIPVVMVTGIRRDMNLPFRFEPDPTWLPVKAVIEKPIKPEALLKIVEDNIKK